MYILTKPENMVTPNAVLSSNASANTLKEVKFTTIKIRKYKVKVIQKKVV